LVRRRHDWAKVKTDYVQGVEEGGNRRYPSVPELSKKYGISVKYAQEIAAKQNWVQERRIFESKLQDLRETQRITKLLEDSTKFDSDNLNIAKAGVGVVGSKFTAHLKATQTLMSTTATEEQKEEAKTHILSGGALETLSKAIVNYQRLGKIALGEPEEQRIQIEGQPTQTIIVETYVPESSRMRKKDEHPSP
jgi:hypothetical protein